MARDEEGLGAEFGAVEISNSSLDKGGDLLNEVGRYQGFFSLFQGDLISGQSVKINGDLKGGEDVKSLTDQPADHPGEYIPCSS